jgi:hypothetical protein
MLVDVSDIKIHYNPFTFSCLQTDRRTVVGQQDAYAPEYYETVVTCGSLALHAIRVADTAPMLYVRWRVFLREDWINVRAAWEKMSKREELEVCELRWKTHMKIYIFF